jgi:hypothetical protein
MKGQIYKFTSSNSQSFNIFVGLSHKNMKETLFTRFACKKREK